MPLISVDLDNRSAVYAVYRIVNRLMFFVDADKRVLSIDILSAFRTESLAKELYELFLGAAAAGAYSFVRRRFLPAHLLLTSLIVKKNFLRKW